MSHLKSTDVFRCVDGIYCSLFGPDNYTRWKKLKDNVNMTSGSEADFVSWILDYIDAHLETVDVMSKLSSQTIDMRSNSSYSTKEEIVLLDHGIDSSRTKNQSWPSSSHEILSSEVVDSSSSLPMVKNMITDVANDTLGKSGRNKRKTTPPIQVNEEVEEEEEENGPVDEAIDLSSSPETFEYLNDLDGNDGSSFYDDFLTNELVIDDNVDWSAARACTSPIATHTVDDGGGHSNKTRQYLCEICYSAFPSYRELVAHQTSLHDRDNTEKCRFCHKAFIHRVGRLKHERQAHSLRTYPCDTCGKVFFEKASVTRHKKAKHSNIRFQCKKCEQSFTQVGNLRRHERRMHDVIIHVATGV